MTARRKRKDTAPPIGDHLLTLREAAEVLRLSTRTVREYTQRGEIEARIIGGRWRFRRADLDAFFENAPSEWDFGGKDTGIRWCITGKDRRVAGINTSLARGRDSTARTCPSSRLGLCEAISTIRAEFPICWSGKMSASARSKSRCAWRTSVPVGEKATITRN